jgi:hypothetical protein
MFSKIDNFENSTTDAQESVASVLPLISSFGLPPTDSHCVVFLRSIGSSFLNALLKSTTIS